VLLGQCHEQNRKVVSLQAHLTVTAATHAAGRLYASYVMVLVLPLSIPVSNI
jgi:hypothetical protein